jgi:cupin superfamily acireductone dioxygenase involved in methionine salvage
MRSYEQDHFPFRPVADVADVAENDAEKDNLPAKPENLHQHPEQEVRFETQLANEGVPKDDGVYFDVTPHALFLSLSYMRSQTSPA